MHDKRGSRLPRSHGLPEFEAKGFARSLVVDTVDFGPSLPAEAIGRALCWRDGQRLSFAAACRPDLSAEENWHFEQWARLRAYLLAVTLDPGFDGWRPLGKRRWELIFQPDIGPDDPFGPEPLDWL